MKPEWKPIEEPPEVSMFKPVRCTLFGAEDGLEDDVHRRVVLIYVTRTKNDRGKDVWEDADGDPLECTLPHVTFTHWDFEPEWPEQPKAEDDTWTSINSPPKAQVITDFEDLTQYLIIWCPRGCEPELTLAHYVKDTYESAEHFYNDGVIEDVLLWKHPPSIPKDIELLNGMCVGCKKEKQKPGEAWCPACLDDIPF